MSRVMKYSILNSLKKKGVDKLSDQLRSGVG